MRSRALLGALSRCLVVAACWVIGPVLAAAPRTPGIAVNPQAFSGGPDADSQVLEDSPEGNGMLGAPETPSADPRDFNGLWRPGATPRIKPLVSVNDVFALEEMPLRAAARQFVEEIERIRRTGKPVQLATTACRSPTVNTALFPSFVTAIVQTPRSLHILYEQPRLIQSVRIDGSPGARGKASYAGHSVGRWEGDTLVVETRGFNGRGELDITGAPVSSEAVLVQRIRKSSDGKTLHIRVRVEDPVNLTDPIEVDRRWRWTNGIQQGEYDCEENPREDMSEETHYMDPLYQPVCVRIDGEGEAPSRVECRVPGSGAAGTTP